METAHHEAPQTDYTTQYIKDEKDQAEFYDFFKGLSPNVEIDKQGVLKEEKREAGKKDGQS